MKTENKYGSYTLQYVTASGNKTITVELDGNLDRHSMLIELQKFMQACGYKFDSAEWVGVKTYPLSAEQTMKEWAEKRNQTADTPSWKSIPTPYASDLNLTNINLADINMNTQYGRSDRLYGAVPSHETRTTENPNIQTSFKFNFEERN